MKLDIVRTDETAARIHEHMLMYEYGACVLTNMLLDEEFAMAVQSYFQHSKKSRLDDESLFERTHSVLAEALMEDAQRFLDSYYKTVEGFQFDED